MSITLRDALIHQCWTPTTKPPLPEGSPHHPIQFWGVIDDPRYRMNGERPFADVVAFWPALGIWTVTSQCRMDADVDDVPVRVTFYQPLPTIPEHWP